MSEPDNSHKPPRKDCIYTPQELQQILPFRDIYKKGTKAERVLVMKSQVLPAMFNYWASNGKHPQSEEESRDWAKVQTGEI